VSSTQEARLVGRVLDELIARLGGGPLEAEVARARAEFDERRGRVFEEEDLWEQWTQAFLEWYVLERVVDGDDLPLAARAIDAGQGETADAVRALLRSHRSVFEVRSTQPGRVELRDMIGGALFAVDEKRAMHGVEPGDVVEARLVGLGEQVSFTRTFWFHPAGTRDAVEKHIARLRHGGASRLDILDHLASLRVKCERYKHMAPDKLYEQSVERAT
jgi:hypothetical protein